MSQKPEEREIYAIQQGWVQAWNNGDAEALAAYCSEDCLRIGIRGDVQRGREEIRKAMVDLFRAMPGSRLSLEGQTLRFLSPEIAVWQGYLHISRPAGNPIDGHAIEVLQKTKGRWLIVEQHPRVFAPPNIL